MAFAGLFDSEIRKGCETSRNINFVPDRYFPVTFFSENRFEEAKHAPESTVKIAWIQSLDWLRGWRKRIVSLRDDFDLILTCSRDVIENETDCLYCPCDWATAHPNKYVNIHKSGLVTTSSMPHTVASHKYAVVTEHRIRGRFTRRLLNCFTTGTVPIYRGAPDIAEYFDYRGIITYRDDADLTTILNYIGEMDFKSRQESIEANREISYQYLSAGDWLYKNYTYLFENCDENN